MMSVFVLRKLLLENKVSVSLPHDICFIFIGFLNFY